MWIRKSHGRWGSPVGLDTTNFMKQDLQQAWQILEDVTAAHILDIVNKIYC
jgi:hypothetical protein